MRRPRAASFVAAIALSATVLFSISGTPRDASAGACPSFGAPVLEGRVSDDRLNEISGVVAARAFPGMLWLEEDSGNAPWVYASTTDGTIRAAIEVTNGTNRDWEDMARAGGRLWVGDIGDNAQARSSIQVYWFAEPTSLTTDSVEANVLELTYPGGQAHNAEAMIVDGRSDRLFIFEKRSESPSRVFVADVSGLAGDAQRELREVAEVPLRYVTAADLSKRGIIVKNNSISLLFPWSGRGLVRTLRGGVSCPIELPNSESVAFSLDRQRMYTIPEGRDAEIHSIEVGW